jgi:Leucine-rich repeat (LRR) protein
MSRQGLTELHGFTIFRNLSSLYLEGNKLKSLSGLHANLCLQRLHAAENELEDVSTITAFHFLADLGLAHNALADLDGLLAFLRPLHFLRVRTGC